MSKARCECGRPALVLPAVRRKSSRKTKARRPVAMKEHPLCGRCHERQRDSWFGRGAGVDTQGHTGYNAGTEGA